MPQLTNRITELYEEFKNTPKPKIVRAGHDGDAFALLVFETLFQEHHNAKKLSSAKHTSLIRQSVVPPPDDSIDIFFQESNLDERTFHIVQCKYQKLAAADIETCFLRMKNAIETYLKSPKDVQKSLRAIIGDTDFNEEYRDNCVFYVVHTGNTDSIRNQRDNYKIITADNLSFLMQGLVAASVPIEEFDLDTANNFIVNNFVSGAGKKEDPNVPSSILCNLNGYDLAMLDEKYAQTELGRNILYGGNLRESLSKKSKTYAGMFETISSEPDLFLFYNNGITILAEDFDSPRKEKIILKKFSIINGAQTTSTLGLFLREAKANKDFEAIEKLKKVLVLTKIYEINPQLNHHEKVSERIRIYNNTQTPLSSRDMVSIRPEQNQLKRKLQESKPELFVSIKKGEKVPGDMRLLKHQEVSNETLAQLSLCGYFFEPYTAIHKKVRLFDNEGKDGVLLNEIYSKLFDPDKGVLFRKTNSEIDELLFIHQLHNDTRNAYKKKLTEQITEISQSAIPMGQTSAQREDRIAQIKRNLDIANKSLFFDIACYFKIRQRFDFKVKKIGSFAFQTNTYYEKKDFKAKLIAAFSDLVFARTVRIIRGNTKGDNVYNWLRVEGNQQVFFDSLENELTDKFGIDDEYATFVKDFKVEG
jgi:hypothetical protein